MKWRDWDTGQESDFADVNCGAFYYEEGGAATNASSACILGGGGGDTIATGVNVTAGCKNALASTCYTVSTHRTLNMITPGCTAGRTFTSLLSVTFSALLFFGGGGDARKRHTYLGGCHHLRSFRTEVRATTRLQQKKTLRPFEPLPLSSADWLIKPCTPFVEPAPGVIPV